MIDYSSYVVPLLTTCLAAVAIVFATGLRRGDLLSPFSTSVIILTAIFGIRPILMVSTGSYWFYGLDVSDGVQQASLIGLVGIISLSAGYGLGRVTRRGKSDHSDASAKQRYWPSSASIPSAAVAAGAVLLFWFVVTSYIGGGTAFIVRMFGGRSSDIDQVYTGVPAIVPALPVVAGLLLALSRITVERLRPLTARERLIYWTVIALCVVPPAALGNRRFIVPTIIAGLIGACARTWATRVSIRMVGAAAAIIFVLAIIPFVRSAGSRTGSSDVVGAIVDHAEGTGISGVIEDFFLSYDTEMFSYVAYLAPRLGADGSDIPFGLGRGTFLEMAMAPVPRSLVHLQSWSDTLLTSIFGGGCGTVNCPVPSAFGTLYFDWSYVGLVIFCCLIGFFFSRYSRWFNRSSGAHLIAPVALAAFVPLMARGNMVSQLWIATQVGISLLLIGLAWRLIAGLGTGRPRPAPPRRRRMVTSAARTSKTRVSTTKSSGGVVSVAVPKGMRSEAGGGVRSARGSSTGASTINPSREVSDR